MRRILLLAVLCVAAGGIDRGEASTVMHKYRAREIHTDGSVTCSAGCNVMRPFWDICC